VPARGEDHRVGVDHIPRPVRDVESVGAEDDVVPDQDPRDGDGVQDRDVELRRPVGEGALDLQSGVVPGERGPAIGVGAEEPLGYLAVGFAGEGHSVAFEVVDAAGGVLGHDPHGLGIGQQVALPKRVRRVLLLRVFRVHRRQGCVDAACGELRAVELPLGGPGQLVGLTGSPSAPMWRWLRPAWIHRRGLW
jgi:hypothetical protein